MAFRISENVGNIIHTMKDFSEKADRIKQGKGGWEYAGSEFKSLVICLKESLIREGHNVGDIPVTLGKFAHNKQGPWMYYMAFLSGRKYQKPHERLDFTIDKRNSKPFL